MRKIKLITTMLLVTCVSTSLLAAGCSKKNEEEPTTKAEVVTTTETVTTEPETTTVEETTEEATTEEKTTEATSKKVVQVAPPKKKDKLAELCEEVKNSTTFNSLYEFDSEDLMDYYGIDTSRCDDFVFSVAEVSPCVDTIAMFQAKSQSDARDIADALQVYLDSLLLSTEDYAPEEYDKVCNTGIKMTDSFVYLVIAEDPEPAIAAIEAHIDQN